MRRAVRRLAGAAVRALMGAASIGAVAASAVPAQGVTFTTTGNFSGGGAGCTSGPTCTIPGGFTLAFTPATGTLIADGSNITLGSFLLTGSGAATAPGTLLFTLGVDQTSPSSGSATTQGKIAGAVFTNTTSFSSLFWAPTPTTFGIGPTTYHLVFDNGGPAANVGYNIPINGPKTLSALVFVADLDGVTTAPEPGSAVLFATGLIATVGAAMRRRKSRPTTQ